MISRRFIYYILTAFIVGILALVFIQYNSSRNIKNLIKGNERLVNEFAVSNDLKDLERNINLLENKVEGVVSNNMMLPMEGLASEISAIKKDINDLQLINDDDNTMRYIDQLDMLTNKKLALSKQILDTFFHSGKQAAQVLINAQKGKGLMAAITDMNDKIDSSRQHFLVNITASVDESGREVRRWGIILISLVIVSAMGLFWFIVNRIKQQQLLIQQLDASEKRVREIAQVKENFMANMSHEIRTPMNAILGFADLLKNKDLDPEAREFVQYIQVSGTNLLTIINDVLDLSKIEAGMMRIESTPFNIRELVASVEVLFKEKITDKKLYLNTEIEDAIPDILMGDATRLTQILVNLAGNAVKFTEKGGIRISVFNEQQNDNSIRVGFKITDTGIGIEKDKLADIFERFQQAEDSITRKYGGTGLGLSIVKDLIRLQGGEIRAESESGGGSIFYFNLTYSTNISQSRPHSFHIGNDASFQHLKRARILVVEDNEMNQRLLERLLSEWNMDFQVANNGREAVETLKTISFDLILMDIQMPEVDGYTATRMIRNDLKLNTPVIAMTAHAMKGEKEKCLGHGMNEYLSKPIKKEDLYRFIAFYTGIKESKNSFGNHSSTSAENRFSVIDLNYMKEVSCGNKEYEKEMTIQFIEMIPDEIQLLEEAFNNNDETSLRQIAHNMKTTISVMGLNKTLNKHLDAIEYNRADPKMTLPDFHIIKTICHNALEEAKILLQDFY